MAVEYPDIVCEYIEAKQRYESDGVQIMPFLEPAQIPVGGYSTLIVLIQSALDVPTELVIRMELPTVGRIKAEPLIEIGESVLRVELAPAQVGTLKVPVRATPRAREGQYEVRLNVAVKTSGSASRVRASRRSDGFQSDMMDDVVGLDLGRVLGVSYTVTPTRRISVPFAIAGQAQAVEPPPSMSSQFQSLWKVEDADLQAKARKEVNLRRVDIVHSLAPEPVYLALFVEGRERCARSGAPLRVGEAIALGKMLYFTTFHFLASGDLQDGLLVPIWETALRHDLPTLEPIWVLRNVGFGHLLRLSVALSFGIIGKALNSQPWDLEERRTLTLEISDRLEKGQALPVELVYIPLLAASTIIGSSVIGSGEDVRQSLSLLKTAKAARADVFSDPELAQSSGILDQLLDTALRQVSG